MTRLKSIELSKNAGRFLLGLVALSYGGLCVSLKMVFVRAGPPSVGTLGMIRGFMVLLCFVPQLLDSFKKNKSGEGETEQRVLVGGVGVGDVEFSRARVLQRRFVVHRSHESIIFNASVYCIHTVY